MTDLTIADKLRHMLPTMLPYHVCVAGGYAACPELAGDIDLWVYGIPKGRLESVREDILRHLWETSMVFEDLSQQRCDLQAYDEGNYDTNYFTTLKVARIEPIRGLPVEVMVCDAPSPTAILNGFDITTHMVAINDRGQVITLPGFTTTLAEVPAVVIPNYNSKTGARLAKISARYAHFRKGVSVAAR